MQKYKFLKHTADIKFQAFGKTIEEVFENSALAMFNSMHEGKVKEKTKKEFGVGGKDFEALMYNFLEELLFLFETENLVLSKIKVKINEKAKTLKATIWGDEVKNYEMHIDVKAITYNEMYVKKKKNGWEAQVVLDV